MHPVFATFGGSTVYTYGVFLALASAVALYWAAASAEHLPGVSFSTVIEGGLFALAAGLGAAKAGLLLEQGGGAVAGAPGLQGIARAGGVLHAGLLGGLLAALAYARLRRLPVRATLDAVAASVPLGCAIGRLGCFFAGCCWGVRTSAPWAVVYVEPAASAISGTPLGVPVHPAPLYLAAAELVVFGLVVALTRREAGRTGLALGAMLLLEGLARLVIDPFRGDPRGAFGPLNGGQVLAIALLLVGAAVAAGSRRVGAEARA